MEWSFEGHNGTVTVRQEGGKAVCQAIRPADGKGLYKVWLRGGRGEILLGTLIPEGGALRLRRVMEVALLERQGAWPPTGADIAMTYPFAAEAPPPAEWCWTDCPGKLLEDPGLSRCIERVKRSLLRRDMEGFFLAFPWSPQTPFPLPPLFCLAQIGQLAGKEHVLFRFSRQGRPELLNKFPGQGENRSGT